MFYEYALEPEWVALLLQRKDSRKWFQENFSRSIGRFSSRFPENWVSTVENLLPKNTQDPSNDKEIEEELGRLAEISVPSTRTYDTNKSWLDNALEVSTEFPFRSIIVQNKTDENKRVTDGKTLCWSPPKSWRNEHQNLVNKQNGSELAKQITPLLKISREYKFIDPYFDPHFDPKETKYAYLFQTILNDLVTKNKITPNTLEIHCYPQQRGLSPATFQTNCQSFLTKVIPSGIVATVFMWKNKSIPTDNFHNRYILTEFGGLSFGSGLALTSKPQFDEVTRITEEVYKKRWNQCKKGSPDFLKDGTPFEIQGVL